jgi:hypothetical protein
VSREYPFIRAGGFTRLGSGFGYRPSEWTVAQARARFEGVLYLPVKPKARYWISYAFPTGRVHIATGRAVWRYAPTNRFGNWITLELYCRANLGYPRAIDDPDAAPGFTFCPRCVDASGRERVAS